MKRKRKDENKSCKEDESKRNSPSPKKERMPTREESKQQEQENKTIKVKKRVIFRDEIAGMSISEIKYIENRWALKS